MLAAEWLLLFVPAALFVGLGGFDVRRTLSLRLPSAHGLLGGVVLIAGAVPLVWLVGWLQTFVLPIPWELHEDLQDLVTAETTSRLLWLLLILAVTPAICEEIVFRGVLLVIMHLTHVGGHDTMRYGDETRNVAALLAPMCDGSSLLRPVGGLQRGCVQGGSHVAAH